MMGFFILVMNKTLFVGIDPSITNEVGNIDHNGIVISNNIYGEFIEGNNFIKKTINTKSRLQPYEKITFVIESYIESIKEFINDMEQDNSIKKISDYDYVFIFVEEYKQQSGRSRYQIGTVGDYMPQLINAIEYNAGKVSPNINFRIITRTQAKFINDNVLRKKKLLGYNQIVPLHERDACRVLIVGQNKIKHTNMKLITNMKGEIEYG